MAGTFYAAGSGLARLGRVGLAVGLLGLAGTIAGFFAVPDKFYGSYLVAYLWMACVPLGSLALLMLDHIAGGGWGFMVRRVLEASTRTIPLVALLLVPVLLGLDRIYPWADAQIVAADELIQHKARYLNPSAFALRATAYFVIWTLLTLFLNRMSARQDVEGDNGLANRMGTLSAPGLLVWCLVGTFAGIDWIMSLDPHWYSSLYGVYFFESMALGALAFTVLMAVFLNRGSDLSGVFRKGHFHDYGNLMLAFTMLWAYFTFSQFLIIWSGNLPEEVPWYLERITESWRGFTIALVVLHFAVPFLLLLTHAVKGHPGRLVVVAGLLLVMRYADYFWQVMPPLHRGSPHWLDFSVALALGGIWLAVFCWQLGRRNLLPVNDPRYLEKVSHG
jgi:hypothetical protein